MHIVFPKKGFVDYTSKTNFGIKKAETYEKEMEINSKLMK